MSNYLIGFYSRRRVFHIVEYRDTQEEVEAFLKNHNRRGLVVYAAQQSFAPDSLKAGDSCLPEIVKVENILPAESG